MRERKPEWACPGSIQGSRIDNRFLPNGKEFVCEGRRGTTKQKEEGETQLLIAGQEATSKKATVCRTWGGGGLCLRTCLCMLGPDSTKDKEEM
jgi:hypothetical protein